MGVRYVLLPDTQLGRMGEEREADLLRSGDSGLKEVLATGDWRVSELPGADPILTGPRPKRRSPCTSTIASQELSRRPGCTALPFGTRRTGAWSRVDSASRGPKTE